MLKLSTIIKEVEKYLPPTPDGDTACIYSVLIFCHTNCVGIDFDIADDDNNYIGRRVTIPYDMALNEMRARVKKAAELL